MNSIAAVVSAVAFASALSSSAWGQSRPSNFDLVSADWSPKQAQTLNTLPERTVWDFVGGAFRGGSGRVCDFRFADLRRSSTLSLVTVVDLGGTGGCAWTEIFDKTDNVASGFVNSSIPAGPAGNLRDAIQDIGHDGNLELVLSGTLAEDESQHFECITGWPMIFAWTGSNYTDVSSQYKGYYESYLKSLKKRIAGSSAAQEAQEKAARQTPASLPGVGDSPPTAPNTVSMEQSLIEAAPSAPQASATVPPPDHDCLRLEAAKTEAFLGIHSDDTMSAAIKDSESNDPDQRILAAVIFSYVGTKEAEADLKTLANDSNQMVAELAKQRLTGEPDPGIYEFEEEPVSKAFLPRR